MTVLFFLVILTIFFPCVIFNFSFAFCFSLPLQRCILLAERDIKHDRSACISSVLVTMNPEISLSFRVSELLCLFSSGMLGMFAHEPGL